MRCAWIGVALLAALIVGLPALLLALVGRRVLYHSRYFGRTRDKDGVPVMLVALALVVIGLVLLLGGFIAGLAGAWFNSETAGQGVFMDIYDDSNQLFAGWYTFDLQRPVDGTADLGEAGHRWLTALGPIDGARAELDVFLARGGVFDSADPPIETPQTPVGSMTVEFENCVSGTIAYDLAVPAVSGVIPVQPLTLQHVESCELMSRGPGLPGPL